MGLTYHFGSKILDFLTFRDFQEALIFGGHGSLIYALGVLILPRSIFFALSKRTIEILVKVLYYWFWKIPTQANKLLVA